MLIRANQPLERRRSRIQFGAVQSNLNAYFRSRSSITHSHHRGAHEAHHAHHGPQQAALNVASRSCFGKTLSPASANKRKGAPFGPIMSACERERARLAIFLHVSACGPEIWPEFGRKPSGYSLRVVMMRHQTVSHWFAFGPSYHS